MLNHKKLTIAIDAMGGDNAPAMVIDGLAAAAIRHPGAEFVIFGDENAIGHMLEKHVSLAGRYRIIHTDEVIPSDMKPSTAVRSLAKSSMRMAVQSVAEGECQGVVSAGNTGAYLALTKLILKTLPGIDRPALTSFVPNLYGESVMLDLGANLECSPNNLLQFAIMGECFARYVLHHPKPMVGLLNVGTELTKGSPIVQEAAILIRESSMASNFYGFVEGNDITRGTVDVIVTDGFTGNAVLKSGEGVMELAQHYLKKAFKSSIMAKIGYLLARSTLKRMSERLDHRRYNGGIWLGLNGIAVKSHGGADDLGFAHSVDLAVDMIQGRINEHITKELASTQSRAEDGQKVQDRVAL